ncbi:non-canonical purine NTP phosphatase [Marinomonas agarivorans]|nr:non-canonical purine NTP phosphatase [Marinomonas agarivorans]
MQSSSINVIVGSRNPVKINAAHKALSQLFSHQKVNCTGIHAPSGVARQPMTLAETRLGAINRASYCRNNTEADFYIAIEGGVDVLEDGPVTFAYVAILDNDTRSITCSAQLPLPKYVYQGLLDEEELGDVMDKMFNTNNIKQKEGAIGLLTKNLVTRETCYTQAVIMAMAPFLNKSLYE